MSRTSYARASAPPRASAVARAAALVLVLALTAVLISQIHGGGRGGALPLADAPIIREQAAAKHVDPSLIAAVIYAESKFEPHPSAAGAQGLMQLLPATAYYLAHLSGGNAFTAGDLATPAINVAYGTYYLRYLLDHYKGDEMLAVAAYNAGLGNVDAWVARAGGSLEAQQIPFPETREYVQRVLAAQQAYRATYPQQLGVASR